jgi:hypothetical protein
MIKRACHQSGPRSAVRLLAVLLLVFAWSAAGTAAEVFRWVDEGGVTHFSESPPEQDAQDLQTLEFSDPAPPSDPENDYYSIANQSKRMEAMRAEREKAQAERDLAMRQLELEAAQNQVQQAPPHTEVITRFAYPPSYYPPVWPRPPRPGPYPPGPGHKPPHWRPTVEPYRHPYDNWRGGPGRIRHH